MSDPGTYHLSSINQTYRFNRGVTISELRDTLGVSRGMAEVILANQTLDGLVVKPTGGSSSGTSTSSDSSASSSDRDVPMHNGHPRSAYSYSGNQRDVFQRWVAGDISTQEMRSMTLPGQGMAKVSLDESKLETSSTGSGSGSSSDSSTSPTDSTSGGLSPGEPSTSPSNSSGQDAADDDRDRSSKAGGQDRDATGQTTAEASSNRAGLVALAGLGAALYIAGGR